MANGKVTVTLTFDFDAPDLIDQCGSEAGAKEAIMAALRPHLDELRETVADYTGEVELPMFGEMIPTACYTVKLG
jgi:hypothetical protein